MKKVFTLIIALAFGFGLKAQCPLTQAVDFTATDCHGTEVHLFDILDGGQAVLIDFFFTSCGPCQQATPKVVESYYAMGCNMHDVFYMEISDRDSDAACQTWATNYGVEYPTISGAAGGAGICNTYQIGAFPTVILIMPNHEIVIQDLWPISNAQTVISALEQHGLQQHDCTAPSYDPQVALTIDEVTANSITATFTPNQDCASYYYLYGSEAQFMEWVSIFGQDLIAIIEEYGVVETTAQTLVFDDILPATEYAVVALPVDPNGDYGDYAYELVTTPALPFDETLTFSMDTVMLPYCEITWITVYNNTAEDATIVKICDDLYELNFYNGPEAIPSCEEIELTIPQGGAIELGIECCVTGRNIVPNVVTIASNLPDAQFVVMVDDTWSVGENATFASLFPNPANESVTLKGENLGKVYIYNAIGQKVNEFEANGNELNINTSSYENGIYVVKAGEKAMRFVVRH